MLPLFFLRHADAEPHAAGGDSERALTMKGIAQSKRVGEFCARAGVASRSKAMETTANRFSMIG